jgi:hypothetical protein
MDKQPFSDRGLLLPIGIGVFSVLGIFVILLSVYLDKPQAAVSTTRTATPFKYLLLATETLIPVIEPGATDPELAASDPELEASDPEQTFPEEPEQESPTFSAAGPPQATTLANNTLQPSGAIPATAPAALSVRERYDDADSRLEYDGDWDNQIIVGNAYQGTLSVSSTIGNDLTLTFVGQQIIIGYLGGSNLGSITISIDDDEFQLDQSNGKEWTSPQLADTEHFVIIVHEDGDSVNLDYINVLD